LSEIRATTISDAAGTGPIDLHKQSAAKAWVNFDGTGTVAIADSMNVASLTDDATGQYTSNLTGNMSSANYASTTGSTSSLSGVTAARTVSGKHAVGSCFTHCRNSNSNADIDADQISLVLTGDLA
jgi:hypothetical protein